MSRRRQTAEVPKFKADPTRSFQNETDTETNLNRTVRRTKLNMK